MFIHYTITRDDVETMVTVEYDYTPPHPGEREHGTGLRLDPGNDAEIEICEVKDQSGNILELTKTETEDLELFCLESIEVMKAEDYMEAKMEAQYERLREGY